MEVERIVAAFPSHARDPDPSERRGQVSDQIGVDPDRPALIARPIRSDRSSLPVYTIPERPYAVELASATASSSSAKV